MTTRVTTSSFIPKNDEAGIIIPTVTAEATIAEAVTEDSSNKNKSNKGRIRQITKSSLASRIPAVIHRLKSCQTIDQVRQILKQEISQNDGDVVVLEPIVSQALTTCSKFKQQVQLQLLPLTALEIFNTYCPKSEKCRAQVVSICGSCSHNNNNNMIEMVLKLLKEGDAFTTSGPYNAAIAACGHQKDWQAAMEILHDIMPPHLVTTTSVNAALTALAKGKQGLAAWKLLQEAPMKWNNNTDDNHSAPQVVLTRVSFHTTLSALLSCGCYSEACCLILRAMPAAAVEPNQETFTRLASAVSGRLDARNAIWMEFRDTPYAATLWPSLGRDFGRWTTMAKVGRGQSAYWKLGELHVNHDNDSNADNTNKNNSNHSVVIVGLSPNKNPSANGIRLNFYTNNAVTTKTTLASENKVGEPSSYTTNSAAAATTTTTKLGYLLMINHHQQQRQPASASASGSWANATNQHQQYYSSQFLGQFVDPSQRGKGWAKIFLAVWLRLCLDAGIWPRTGDIHKPLLCLVLQHSFGMEPSPADVYVDNDIDDDNHYHPKKKRKPVPSRRRTRFQRGVQAEISPGRPGTDQVVLYSSTHVLEGAFSPLDLRKQNIVVSRVPAHPRGRPITVGTSFSCHDLQALRTKVDNILSKNCHWNLMPGVNHSQLAEILMGQQQQQPQQEGPQQIIPEGPPQQR